jgi:hypothetical protein
MVYAAAERLSLPGYSLSLPGGGLLPKCRPSLALTAAGRSRSVWRLPGWFLPTLKTQRLLSYHGDFGRWQQDGPDVVLKSAAIGQEFVLQGEDYPKMVDWVSALLTGMVNS